MSYKPKALGLNVPTGIACLRYSPFCPSPYVYLASKFASSPVIVSPVENAVVVPPRAAYSHSASVSNRYCCPVRLDNQVTYCCASSHETPTTGCWSLPHPLSLGVYSQPPAATHESHCSNVVSYLATAK